MTRAALVLALLAGCPRTSDPPPADKEPISQISAVQAATSGGRDAGIDGITTIGGFDPKSGMHLDDDVSDPVVAQTQTRPGHPVDITLRSSPSGARVAVDGVPKGLTPAYWEGTTGAEHEFTFVLEGYGMARYRFVPIASGVVHARLEPIAEDATDAGVGAIGIPSGLPPAVPPIAPPAPATIVSPALDASVVRPDAAIVVVPVDAASVELGPSGVGPQP